MTRELEAAIKATVSSLLASTASPQKLGQLAERHRDKIHFVPIRYRMLGGILQSLNIRSGYLVEKILRSIVDQEPHLERITAIPDRATLSISERSDGSIDTFITHRPLASSPDPTDDFKALLQELNTNERRFPPATSGNYDVDLIFQDKRTNKAYYVEVKYQDDHDTGKFVDINRKILKTYAGLLGAYAIEANVELQPILYYFTRHRRLENIYIPESHIRRGPGLFEDFFTLSYDELDEYLNTISEDPDIVGLFDALYENIRSYTEPQASFDYTADSQQDEA